MRKSVVGLMLATVAAACSGGSHDSKQATTTGPGNTVSVASVKIGPTDTSISVTQTVKLQATVLDSSGDPVSMSVSWSSNPSGRISSSGIVTPQASDTVHGINVVATVDKKTGTAAVGVTPIQIGAVIVTPKTDTLGVGAVVQLKDTVKDMSGNVLARSVDWTTANPLIATVAPSGVVTAVAVGTTTIQATNGVKNAKATIVVKAKTAVAAHHQYVLYAVPERFAIQTSGSTPISASAKVLHARTVTVSTRSVTVKRLTSGTRTRSTDSIGVQPPNSDSIFTLEPWNADSMVYSIGDSATCPSNAGANDPNQTCAPSSWQITLNVQVVDFANDSNAVPGDTVNWNVDSTAYSWNPADANPANGLSAPYSVTDSNGNATVQFSYSCPTSQSNCFVTASRGDPGYGAYFYVTASMKDTTGSSVTQGKFYIVGWQEPTFNSIWDSTAAVAGQPYDISQHVQLFVEEGADTWIATLTPLWVETSPGGPVSGLPDTTVTSTDPNCTVQGTIITCQSAGATIVNVWPNFNTVPAGVNVVNEFGGAVTFYITLPIDSTDGASPSAKVMRRRTLKTGLRR